ncbi:MAG TPA: alpha/beta hydrolase [Xanthobacteraceae bacterium]|nr:alpha/beta hydrolase [Xanthobacteraceae bacterium]
MAAAPALAQECRFEPPPHQKGPLVFMNYDQIELDAAYENSVYEPNLRQISQRLASIADGVRARRGEPRRVAYGPTETEKLDIYKTRAVQAPIFVFIHGGTWRTGSSRRSAFAAELFIDHGAHYVALDFINVLDAGGDLRIMADQVRRGIAWVYRNADSFGGDPNRLYIGGHSSGGHLCGVALTTDWQRDFGLPADTVKGGLCMSGMYDLKPVRLSWRNSYIKFDDSMEHELSAIRHLDMIRAAVTVTYGTFETPEFQRQGRDFAAALEAAGRKVNLIELEHFAHLEAEESLGNPYGPNGRAAIEMMGLARA